jgi:acetyltransferase-like isoleucine patch superfamily enzyme
VLCPRVRIGREAFIGAGAVVVSHVPDLEFWFGNPAKKVRSIRDSERLQPVGEGNADESF